MRQRRLERDHLLRCLRHALAAEFGHQLYSLERGIELRALGVEVQDAARAVIIVNAGFGAQRLEQRTAVERQAQYPDDVAARARRQAFEQKPHAPAPLREVGAQPEQQRRVFAAQPFEYLRRRGGIGPRLGVAHRNLPAIREARLEPRCRLALDHRYLVARPVQKPCAGDADHAGAEHNHFHRLSRYANSHALPANTALGAGQQVPDVGLVAPDQQ